jgi:hypothetical protein
MGADHIAEAGGAFEPQRPFNFVLVLPQDKMSAQENVELAVLSFSVPNRNIQKITIPFLNEERHVAGGVVFEDATLVVVDYVDPDVLFSLDEWFEKVYQGGEDGTGGIGLARDYKAEADMKMFGPDDRESFSRLWHLIGIFPTSLQHGEFNMGSRTEYKQVTATFSVDRMYFKQETASSPVSL